MEQKACLPMNSADSWEYRAGWAVTDDDIAELICCTLAHQASGSRVHSTEQDQEAAHQNRTVPSGEKRSLMTTKSPNLPNLGFWDLLDLWWD